MPMKLPSDEVVFLAGLSPAERNSRLRALWLAGWSLGEISKSFIPNKAKSTIHFWVRNATDLPQNRPVPFQPSKSLTASAPTSESIKLSSISPRVPPSLKDKIRELSILSRQYRANTSPNSQYALANTELTQIARSLKDQGVSTAEIASAAGVTYRAMAKRLSK